jgi:ADP-ribosyl-[dinitrogen reductase] hydrolase
VNNRNYYKDVLLGIAVGDALGVPLEFNTRSQLAVSPVTDMIGFGSHHVPAGTWSDDSSLTFCLADALTGDFNLQQIADNFILWLYKNLWTATGVVFDVGIGTQRAIDRLVKGCRPDLAGGFDSSSNGNGSLMRILPLVFYIKDKPVNERYEITKQVSSITHGHIRAAIACFYYLEFARLLISGENKFAGYQNLKITVNDFLQLTSINPQEVELFNRLLQADIYSLDEAEIQSTGYVLHALEASIWCLLKTNNYKEAVLKAVNLGDDTDTTAAITGGLAGILYGYQSIPEQWINQLSRLDDITSLSERLGQRFNS